MKGLCLVTDRALCAPRTVEEVVRLAVQGGATSVQLRDKDLPTRAFLETAERLHAFLRPRGVPLIINDRVDIALAVGAEGIHVGQDDLPPEVVRRLAGPGVLVGLSVETWEDVVRAQDQPVDYLGVSPVYGTPTKTDTKGAWGLDGLARIRAFSRHPLVAIGGLHAGTIPGVVQAGADGIAVVSALCAAPDPERAARELAALC
ncbi:thiamine phosphate synthase [Mesoterricola sediminis]|uniref:Thiamine-phosphate synthase n=1 Tax=Mesoterricola sediminis TaxID=2927980 RepID=A0AA48GV06_9BACT|nr:thiamine phosphate synthase [Mesoterricola sediminis]BDU78132.1 thiamine-phosphate synthase [Mesoterricola sediminis]